MNLLESGYIDEPSWPEAIGSFDEFRGLLAGKLTWLVSMDLSHCEFFKIELQESTARTMLEQAHPRMREIVASAADAYMRIGTAS